jgi:uncharacterized protein
MISRVAAKMKFVVEKNRFSLVLPDETKCLIDFDIKNDTYILHHTETPPEHQGEGLAGKLSKQVFDYLIQNKIKFIPTCSYLVNYCEKNKIYYDVKSIDNEEI